MESWKWYFENDTRFYQKEFTIDDLEVKAFQTKLKGEYVGYYYDKDFETEKLNISDISLVKKEMNFTFNININPIRIKMEMIVILWLSKRKEIIMICGF